MRKKIIEEVQAIINSPENYWKRLTALRAVTVSNRPGADEARELIRAFVSMTERHETVSETAWQYMKTALVHPFWRTIRTRHNGLREYYLEEHEGMQCSLEGHSPRGMTIQAARTPSKRRLDYLRRTCSDVFAGGHDYRGGLFSDLFGTRVWERDHAPWRDSYKSEWMELIKDFQSEYQAWKLDTFPLSPEYHASRRVMPESKMVPVAFQSDAPKLEQQTEHNRHVSEYGFQPVYPFCEFRGHKIAIEIEEIYDKTYDDFHHGAGELKKTLRAVKIYDAERCVHTVRQQVTLTEDCMNNVIRDLDEENNRAELTPYVGRPFDSLYEFKRAIEQARGVYFNGSYASPVAKSILKHADKTLTGFSGNWLLKIMVEYFNLPKVKVETGLKPIQLSPYFEVHAVRSFPNGYTLYERRLDCELWDYCIVSKQGETFHANSPKDCIKGLRQKRRKSMLAEQQKAGNVFTLRSVRKKYGFCKTGVETFCQANGLDSEGMYLREELTEVISKNYETNEARFGEELRQVGLL